MYAIISELDPVSSSTVSSLWYKLREACGLKEIYNIPTPHFTWFAADGLNIPKAAPILTQIAEASELLNLHVFGLGIFSGEHPILYLPMVKSMDMISLHQKIWNQTQPYSEGKKFYYSPRLWVPHITLALKDLTRENMACAVNAVSFEPIELFVTVNSLAIVEHIDENIGKTLEIFKFNG